MPSQFHSEEERTTVEAEQIKTFFNETNDQNLAGALIMSLLVYVVHADIPTWTWEPALFGLYAVTLVRAWLVWQFHRAPSSRSTADWARTQAISGGLSGTCWGVANTAMLAHLSTEFQLVILTVITVSAATNASEGFAFTPPSRAYILASLCPPIIWLLTVGDRLHSTLALMLMVFVPMTLWQSIKRNRTFIKAQQLRFRNEALARELTLQRDATEQAKTIGDRERIRLQTILKTASDGIHILDHDGVLVDANEAFLNMLGYDQSAIGKLRLTDWSQSPQAESRTRLDELASPGSRVFFETSHRRRDGSVLDVEISASGVTIEGMGYIYAASRDITERKQQEQVRLEREKAHRDVLVREVHHRIKNNLQSVAGLLHRELGRFLELDPRLETAISQIEVIASVHGLQGSNLSEDIFLFHVIENICMSVGKILQSPVQLQFGDANSACQSVQLGKDEAVSIALVLNELIMNAIKHSPQGSSAPTVSAICDGEYAQIVIRNAVAGVPDFDIDSGKSIGTGLSLVRSLLPYEGVQLRYQLDTEGFMLTQITLTPTVIAVC